MQPDDIVRRITTGVLVACLAVVAVTVCAATVPAVKNRLGFATTQSLSYTVGGRIDVPASLYRSTSRTVLVFSRASCGACQRAKPVEAAIALELTQHPDVPVLIVTDTTFQKDESAFAHAVGIPPSRLFRTDLTKLHLKRIPAIVVVDRSGKVLASEEGIPSEVQHEAIVRTALSGLSQAP
jgi:hypothetical protein